MISTERKLEIAKEAYGALGVDVDRAMETAASTPVSI